MPELTNAISCLFTPLLLAFHVKYLITFSGQNLFFKFNENPFSDDIIYSCYVLSENKIHVFSISLSYPFLPKEREYCLH